MYRLLILLTFGFTYSYGYAQLLKQPIPDKLVVLTFDDGVISHATYVAPLLKKYGFGATFFMCEFPPDFADKTKYMSWEQVQELDRMGFEVANHTRNHTHLSKLSPDSLSRELNYVEQASREHGVKHPVVSFAYPAYGTAPFAIDVLRKRGYLSARAGYNRAYDPQKDHPYLLPGFTVLDTNKTAIMAAFAEAKQGRVVILTIHGVPDLAHPWVTTSPELFETYLRYLRDNHYLVIALRDLAHYINVEKALDEIKPAF